MQPVLIATSEALPDLDPDERLFLEALAARGIPAEPAVWSNPAVDWSAARATVLRTTWDYSRRAAEFRGWLTRVDAATTLLNSLDAVAWNLDKHYLCGLAARGVPTIPTEWLPAGTRIDLRALVARTGWDEFVLKPAVGQTAREAMCLGADELEVGQAHLDRLLPEEAFLMQPFLAGVREAGELSLVYIGGAYSHAVKKTPARGDWRVQNDFGGSLVPVEADQRARELGARSLDEAGFSTLYARVDLLADGAGQWLVIELELIEPALFFGAGPGSAQLLAAALEKRLDQSI